MLEVTRFEKTIFYNDSIQFYSCSYEASEILKNNKQVNRIVNTPGKIENGCGLSIYVNDTDIDKITEPIQSFLDDKKVKAIYSGEKEGLSRSYTLIKEI